MAENIWLELTAASVCGILGGIVAFSIRTQLKKNQKLSEYREYLNKNDAVSVNEAIRRVQLEGTDKRHIIYVEGKAASGAFVLGNNVKKLSPKQVHEEVQNLRDLAEDKKKRQLLFSRNFYKKASWFAENIFDSDIEAQNFYLVEDSSKDNVGLIQIQPSSDIQMLNYEQKRIPKKNDSTVMDIISKTLNTLFFSGSYFLYRKYSQIVYEGDNLKVFGTFQFNPYANRWEIDNPIAFIQGGKSELISTLGW